MYVSCKLFALGHCGEVIWAVWNHFRGHCCCGEVAAVERLK